jgi:2,4-dienoyl-CoA reductase-like NADH-dependent reductase (Old Yellow Enzyme family)
MGRVSHPDFQGGTLPVGPSPIAADGEAHTQTGKKPYVVPHELSIPEISKIVHDYADATLRARDAGFDGVEIHGANGYLIDQFLRDSANRRSDEYGGSIENRSRFLREVVEAVTAAWSADRVGGDQHPVRRKKRKRSEESSPPTIRATHGWSVAK